MRSKEDLLNYGGPDRIVPAMEMAIKFQNEPEFLISLRSGIHTLISEIQQSIAAMKDMSCEK